MITTEQLDAWQALCDAATPGPWPAHPDHVVAHEGNAAFISEARIALPQLIDEMRSLRAHLHVYQTAELERRMLAWARRYYSGWRSGVAAEIWNLQHKWVEDDDMRYEAMLVAWFGQSIDAWCTDWCKIVTIAEWEKMVIEQ